VDILLFTVHAQIAVESPLQLFTHKYHMFVHKSIHIFANV